MLRSIGKGIRAVLPRGTRRQIGRVGRFFALPDGFEVIGGVAYPSIEGGLRYLKSRGFQPCFAVDIGAYVGEWTILFKEIFPQSQVLMVEAQEDKRERLEAVCRRFEPSVTFRVALLGPTTGIKTRFVEMETGSSVYEEQGVHLERRMSEKATITLDDLLASDPRPVDLLKLDVQGYELEVLRGARRYLQQAQSVLLEASLVATNTGAPLIAEVIRFMDEEGFRVVDICGMARRRDGVLWQADLLFVRTSSPLVPDVRLTHDNWP